MKETVCGFRMEVDATVPPGEVHFWGLDGQGRPRRVGGLTGLALFNDDRHEWEKDYDHATSQWTGNESREMMKDFIRNQLRKMAESFLQGDYLKAVLKEWGL